MTYIIITGVLKIEVITLFPFCFFKIIYLIK